MYKGQIFITEFFSVYEHLPKRSIKIRHPIKERLIVLFEINKIIRREQSATWIAATIKPKDRPHSGEPLDTLQYFMYSSPTQKTSKR